MLALIVSAAGVAGLWLSGSLAISLGLAAIVARLSVRALEPDAERGSPSPVPTPAAVLSAVADEADRGES